MASAPILHHMGHMLHVEEIFFNVPPWVKLFKPILNQGLARHCSDTTVFINDVLPQLIHAQIETHLHHCSFRDVLERCSFFITQHSILGAIENHESGRRQKSVGQMDHKHC